MTACGPEERVFLFVDDELSESEGLALAEHLVDCNDCRRKAISYMQLGDALRDLGRSRVPPSGWQDRVRAEIESPRKRYLRYVGVLIFAVVASAGFLLWLFL